MKLSSKVQNFLLLGASAAAFAVHLSETPFVAKLLGEPEKPALIAPEALMDPLSPQSDPLVLSGTYVPITRGMKSSHGVSFGELYDAGLVQDNNSSTSYELAAETDTDHDGYKNWEEIKWGTSPTASNAYPMATINMQDREVFWPSRAGTRYKVISQNDLVNPTLVATNTYDGADGVTTHSISNGSGAFYRVETE